MKNEQLILFDFDGTIADTFAPAYEFVKQYYQETAKLDLSIEQFRELFSENALQAIVKQTNTSIEEYKSFHHSEYKDAYLQSQLFEGIKSILEELSESHVLGLVTSSYAQMFMPIIDENDLNQYFAVFLGADMGSDKRDKITIAMDEFGFSKDETIFISDSVGDIMEAKEVGVQTIAVSWGFSTKSALESIKPDRLITTPEELKHLI